MKQKRAEDRKSSSPLRKSKTKKIPLEVSTKVTKRSIHKIFSKVTTKL
jgi:hypothetical protein